MRKLNFPTAIIRPSRTLGRYTLTILSIPIVLAIRLIAPFVLVRVGYLHSSRIGHFAADTELYLLETKELKKVSKAKIQDFVCYREPVCNRYLGKMWRRTNGLTVVPVPIINAIYRVNSLIPGGTKHIAGLTKQHDRDVSGLFYRYPPVLSFTQEEQRTGELLLRDLGVPKDRNFVCLHVRDSSYLANQFPWADTSYHNYRDSNIEDYYLTAEALAMHGLYVLRTGAIVKSPLQSKNPMIIDYALSGKRSEFADLYLGANCYFCISTGSGFDAIPYIFRRPILYVNLVPIEYMNTYSLNYSTVFKHHDDSTDGQELPFVEIFTRQAGRCVSSECFQSKGISLRDNSPDEIMEAAMEMVGRLEGTFLESDDDKFLESEFWRVFPKDAVDDHVGMPLHGQIRARVSITYLRSNRSLLRVQE